ncbi:GNAT family N-acetyltransferase [Celerinatantimonas sp. YJH-8]|uniref:GNAT family N-acetyltransferase n=1 Tax=Celerinatantimonas sp. YJH-8 TaxID=3228714 RepID=UPI0038C2D522
MIRLAKATDSISIAHLATELGYPVSPEQIQSRLTALAAETQIWVYQAAQNVVAWMQLSRTFHLTTGSSLEIVGLVVDSHYRSQQIGTQLLNHAKHIATHEQLELTVRSQQKRTQAHRFYQNNGFIWQKTQLLFRLDSQSESTEK